eukprot:CCRYP_006526-RA/>CCRYP_006526-RA protein AED:0.47 eAED:0.61 QI:0/0/0/1/0/0/3/0/79
MYSLTRSEEGKLNSLLVLTSPKVLFEEASYCLLQQSSTSTLNQVVDFLDALTPSAFESISFVREKCYCTVVYIIIDQYC